MAIIWKKIWARKYTPFVAERILLLFSSKSPQWGICKNRLFVPERNVHGYYFEERELENVKKIFKNYLLKQSPQQFAQKYENEFKKFLNWAKKYSEKSYKHWSNKQLIKLILEINKQFTYSGNWQMLSFIAQEGIVTDTENDIRRLSNGDQFIQAILTPPKLTQINQANLKLLRMAANGRVSHSALVAYAKKYAWVTIYEFIDKPLTVKSVKRRLISAPAGQKQLSAFLSDRKKGLAAYKKFLKQIGNQPQLKKMVEISHQFTYLKDMRDDYRRPAYRAFSSFWQEIAKRTGLTVIEANHLVLSELIEAVSSPSKKFKVLANQRMLAYALELREGKFKIYSGQKGISKITRQVLQKYQSVEIKGQAAYAGKATGRVVVINHQSEFKKFKNGDILVTVMTHPEFLPLMRHAKAIITDEGGLTCHAAITAREFKVPCLIGTKFATKIFKDGDMVEVDANKGIVKKIA